MAGKKKWLAAVLAVMAAGTVCAAPVTEKAEAIRLPEMYRVKHKTEALQSSAFRFTSEPAERIEISGKKIKFPDIEEIEKKERDTKLFIRIDARGVWMRWKAVKEVPVWKEAGIFIGRSGIRIVGAPAGTEAVRINKTGIRI